MFPELDLSFSYDYCPIHDAMTWHASAQGFKPVCIECRLEVAIQQSLERIERTHERTERNTAVHYT